MTTSSSSSILDVDLTIVLAKHLKNVNWRYGDLKPYAIVSFGTDKDTTDSEKTLRFTTKSDDAGSTTPVWNDNFVFPIAGEILDRSVLSIDVFHSKPSETTKPLVGTVRCSLKDLLGIGSDRKYTTPIRTLQLLRPSGRPQGKLRLKISFRERIPPPSAPSQVLTRPPPDYSLPPPSPYYYSNTHPTSALSHSDYQTYSAPPPQPPTTVQYSPATASSYQQRTYVGPYNDYYSTCPGYKYSAPPAPSARTTSVPPPSASYYSTVAYGEGGPSAPPNYSSYNQRGSRSVRMEVGAGPGIGAVSGALGGMTLEEGLKSYEENKLAESDHSFARDNHSTQYRNADY